jgi:hypothetical protein
VPSEETRAWGVPTAAGRRPGKLFISPAWTERIRARRPTTPSRRERFRGRAGAWGSERESNPGTRARTWPVESFAARKPAVSSSTVVEREERARTRKEEAEGSP